MSQSGAKCAILQFWFRFEKTRIFTLHFYCGHRIKQRIGRYTGQRIMSCPGNRACDLFDGNRCCFASLPGSGPVSRAEMLCFRAPLRRYPPHFCGHSREQSVGSFWKRAGLLSRSFFNHSSGFDRPFFRSCTWWSCELSGSRNVLKQEHHCPIRSGT